MKSCIEWRKSFPYLDQIDQYNIDFRNKPEELINFLNQYATEKRVNMVLTKPSQNDIQLIIELHKLNKYNIVVCLEPDMYFIDMLKENKVPFYLPLHINSWDLLQYVIDLGVSDVFITDQLGFDLKRVSKITKEKGIQIRCYANITQVGQPYENNDGLKGFYIRPDDVDIYSEFVDVIEFYKSVDIQKTLYEVYFIAKEWDGPLREIIKGLKNQVNDYYILTNEFGKRRVHCRKKCIKGEKCQLCEREVELANAIENNEEYEVFKRRMINGKGSIS